MDNYVITIARGYGSGGKTIGKMLAKELGINVYDKEILRLASDDSGISEELFARADEKVKNTSLFRAAKNAYKGEVIPPESDDFTSNENLFNFQAKVIKDLAEKESFVVIGRAADYILKDYKNVVKIFVHAPMDYCIDTVEKMSSMSKKEIENFIIKTDRQRAGFYHYYTGRDWNDARNYDLCLNSYELTYEKCVEMVKEFVKIKLH